MTSFYPLTKYSRVQKIILSTACFFITTFAAAQINTLMLLKDYKPLSKELKTYVSDGQVARFNKTKAIELLTSKPANIELSFEFENQEWVIELTETSLLSKDFMVTTGSNPGKPFNYNKGTALHYKGKIKGKQHSFAAVSIMADQLVAVIADEKGNINIGAVNTSSARKSNEHIIYRESSLLIKNEFVCGTEEAVTATNSPVPVYIPAGITAATVNTEPVDIYFEADNTTYSNNGSSVTNTVNYVTALFNVVHLLFENDSINANISAIKVWDIQDPYNSLTTTATVLNAFSANMANGFPGDVAHFLCQRALGGGRAYLDVLCSSDAFKTGVSGNLNNSFNQFPAYSWSTMVVTHEIGHNLGSPHTQSCTWPGGAIDNCYATEGGCAPGPAPVNGGTMMSYCHLTSNGINFANGFGPLPGALIRSRLRNSTCINPAVSFENTSQIIAEDSATVENGCSDYKLLTARIFIPYAPSQPASITVLPTGSAGLIIGSNKDVEITPLNFTLDSTHLSQIISIKVYNDALIENTETLTLNFTLNANSGNAIKKNSNTTHSVTITDSDHRPDSTTGQPLYYESFDTVSTGTGSWQQTILYGAASANRWIIANSGDSLFPSKAAYISNNGSDYSYSGAAGNDSATLRLASPVINANGFSNMHITYAYKCMGEITFNQGGGTGQGESFTGKDFGKLLYSTDNGSTWVLLKDNIAGREIKQIDDVLLPAAANNSNIRIAFEWRNNTSVVNNPPLLIDSIVIKGTATCSIQTTAHPANANEAYLGPNQTVHYYNPVTGNIIASIENNSSFDFGCTRVELIRTGNGAAAAWDSNAVLNISDKAYKITAENNNTAAAYKLTLYYTNDEINGWKAATGNSNADISIVKTSGDILSYPVAAPAEFSSINNISSFGATPHLAISSVFTGFSSFAIGKVFSKGVCPQGNIQYAAGITGAAYQWQLNAGGGYTNISNNSNYSGSSSDTLRLLNAPTAWYGYHFRCKVTGAFGTVYSAEQFLKFGMTWIGTQSKAWEDPLNWGCANLPDANTDVIINAGTLFTPEISSNGTIRSLLLSPNATITIKNGNNLLIKH
jgi:hypothetical protein